MIINEIKCRAKLIKTETNKATTTNADLGKIREKKTEPERKGTKVNILSTAIAIQCTVCMCVKCVKSKQIYRKWVRWQYIQKAYFTQTNFTQDNGFATHTQTPSLHLFSSPSTGMQIVRTQNRFHCHLFVLECFVLYVFLAVHRRC